MHPPSPLIPHAQGWLRPLLGWGLVLIALTAVFSLYTQPEFMRTLADQVWSCF